MITRRVFVMTSTLACAPFVQSAEAASRPRTPLRAALRRRRLQARPARDGKLLLFSDGPSRPQNLITADALERSFGKGVERSLTQPDHWRMIEAGWFAGDDVYEPSEFGDPAYQAWHACHKPEVEAHDLLLEYYGEQFDNPIGGMIPELGLEFGEHPNTPRLALAKLVHQSYLPRLAADLAEKTDWLWIDPVVGASD